MMEPQDTLDPATRDDQLVARLLEEITQRIEAGLPVDLNAYEREYPQHIERIRRAVPALQVLDQLGLSAARSSGPAGSPQSAPLGGTLGDYRILCEIGRGGMGIVYEAEQISLHRRVALKVLPFAAMLDPRHLQRFKNEAQAAASLKHPNIVGIHSVGCERGVHYYAMEYVEGQTLAEVIAGLRQGSGDRDQGTGTRGEGTGAGDEGWRLQSPLFPEGPGTRGEGTGESGKGEGGEGGMLSQRAAVGEHAATPDMPTPAPQVKACHPTDSPPHPVTPSPTHSVTDTHPLAFLSTEGSTRTPDFFRSVARLGIQAAEALEHAHQMGVVHRDIKPSNLMVESRLPSPSGRRAEFPLPSPSGRGAGGEGPRLWITDFGLARISAPSPLGGEGRGEGGRGEGASLTMTGDILGTLRYMSPEQLQAKHGVLDHRTDVYSLGLTLYEVLTLQPAFPGDDRQNLIRQVAEDDPRPPRQLNKSVPKDLETIILKATAKEPQDRYATARQLADDLRRFLADEPIRARRPSLVERSRKCARRHRAVVWSAVAALFVVVAILGISAILVLAAYDREKEQHAAAEANADRAEENAAKAQRNYEAARKAINQMVTRVADEQLAKIPEMKEVRRRVLEDAAAFYTELLKLSPRDPRAYFERGQVYLRLVQYDKVRADYEKASELEPDNSELHGALAAFLGACPDTARRDLKSALLHAKWAVRLQPHNFGHHGNLATVYLNLGEDDKAAAEMRQAAELSPNPLVRMSCLARACSLVGDLKGAVEWLKKRLALDPNGAGPHGGLAELYVNLGEYENAVVSATKAIELSRKFVDESANNHAYTNYEHRGEAYAGLKMYPQALADYDRSLELAPFRSYTYKRRALIHFHLKNYDKALADIGKALELKPEDASALWWIPIGLQAKCPDDSFRRGMLRLHEKALASLQKLVDESPDNPVYRRPLAEAYLSRGHSSWARGDFDKAIADCEEALRINPANGQAKNELAWWLVTHPDPQRRHVSWAVKLANEAVALDPKAHPPLNTLGVAQYRAGDYQAAIETLDVSVHRVVRQHGGRV